jgi:hypothetical protein
MAVVVGSCCFSVLTSTVKFRRFATSQRSIGSITPKAISHRSKASSPKRGSSSSSSSSSAKSNREVNLALSLSLSLSFYVCLCVHETIRSEFGENGNFIFEAIVSVYLMVRKKKNHKLCVCDIEYLGVYGMWIVLL